MAHDSKIGGARDTQIVVERRCPYCRGQGHLYEFPESRFCFVECDSCHSATSFGRTREEVLGNWDYKVVARYRKGGGKS